MLGWTLVRPFALHNAARYVLLPPHVSVLGSAAVAACFLFMVSRHRSDCAEADGTPTATATGTPEPDTDVPPAVGTTETDAGATPATATGTPEAEVDGTPAIGSTATDADGTAAVGTPDAEADGTPAVGTTATDADGTAELDVEVDGTPATVTSATDVGGTPDAEADETPAIGTTTTDADGNPVTGITPPETTAEPTVQETAEDGTPSGSLFDTGLDQGTNPSPISHSLVVSSACLERPVRSLTAPVSCLVRLLTAVVFLQILMARQTLEVTQ